ncbi:unnamed protein product, partial [Didymodactylos carnosus]
TTTSSPVNSEHVSDAPPDVLVLEEEEENIQAQLELDQSSLGELWNAASSATSLMGSYDQFVNMSLLSVVSNSDGDSWSTAPTSSKLVSNIESCHFLLYVAGYKRVILSLCFNVNDFCGCCVTSAYNGGFKRICPGY